MTYDKIVNKEIQYPVQNHIWSPARRIAKELLRNDIPERFIEKIYNLRNKMR